jgi:hypothetical protein
MLVAPQRQMTADFIPFVVIWGIVLLYPVGGLIVWRTVKRLKLRIAAEQCPKCEEIFGPAIVRTFREIGTLGHPAGRLWRVVCPHCLTIWEYCDGRYTHETN